MNVTADHDDDTSNAHAGGNRLRFELIFASAWLAFGLFLLPGLIFWVGGVLLGTYGDTGAGASTFYIDFFGDLADLSGRAWLIALGPLLLIYSLRAVFIGARPKTSRPSDDIDAEEPPPIVRRRAPAPKPAPTSTPRQAKRPASTRPARVEPRMGAD